MSTKLTVLVHAAAVGTRAVAAVLYLVVFGAVLTGIAALSGITPFAAVPFWAYQAVILPGVGCLWVLYTDATLRDFLPGIG